MTREELGQAQIHRQFRLAGSREKPLLPPEPPKEEKPEPDLTEMLGHFGYIWTGP